MTDRQLLDEVIEFRALLIEYGNKVGEDRRRDEVEGMRTNLNIKWGRINRDLAQLGFPLYIEQFGRRFPIMQLALRESGLSGPDYDTMRTLAQALEEIIGTLQHRIEEAPARRLWKVGYIAAGSFIVGLVVLAWAFGRFQDTIWNDLARRGTWLKDLVFTGDRPWAILVTIVGGFAIGMLVNQVHQDRWAGAFRRRPVSTIVYILLTITCTVAGVVLSR